MKYKPEYDDKEWIRTSIFIIIMAALLALIAISVANANESSISISLSRHTLTYTNGDLREETRIGCGALQDHESLTPVGTFRIVFKCVNPNSSSRFGTRIMGLDTLGKSHRMRICMHGTNEPEKLGTYCSHGCIRMSNSFAEQLYKQVKVGDLVRIEP